ncbi:MAG: hypothetical protein J2P28_09590 [Actinobacteria bacterium]|nr:hypothetical protein [Actinomycetota bacterium]
MSTVVLDPVPAEVEELIERRRALGLDLFDEVWAGTYHMAPAPPLPSRIPRRCAEQDPRSLR